DDNSSARAISADASTIVGFNQSADGRHAVRWTVNRGIQDLGTVLGLPGEDSEAIAVSGDGSIIIGSDRAATFDSAFIWDAIHGMRFLKDVLGNALPTGANPRDAYTISADGSTVAGGGFMSSGRYAPFIATIPEPGSLAFLMIAGVGLQVRRRRNRSG